MSQPASPFPRDQSISDAASSSPSRIPDGTRSRRHSSKGLEYFSASPRDYATRVREHSQTHISNSLYSGQKYDTLAEFLCKPYDLNYSQPASRPRLERKEREFAWLYELLQDTPAKPEPLSPRPRHITRHITPEHNSLLILRGYPSAQWLNELGSRYQVDPEFWHRHLTFLIRGNEQQRMSFVLPSSQRTIFQLPLTSVGTQANDNYADLETKRAEAASKMNTYLHNLRIGAGWECGKSVVRAINIHDEELFSIEQKVTVYVSRIDKSNDRWIVILWFDCGDDLSESLPGPWFDSSNSGFHTYFHPTILFKPNIPFKDHKIETPGSRSSGPAPRSLVHQSANLLSTCYGRSLHTVTMSRDPFYALTELFSFVSTSEITFLNAISSKLEDTNIGLLDLDAVTIFRTQTKLLHYRRILEEQAHKISEVLTFIKNRRQLKWPQSDLAKAANAAERTEQDFEYLFDRNILLQKRCERDLTTIMNNANIAEARGGITMAHRVFRLTLVATLYVPLSFTTSLFGMNFIQFERNSQGYWIWTLTTIPIILLSSFILLWEEVKWYLKTILYLISVPKDSMGI